MIDIKLKHYSHLLIPLIVAGFIVSLIGGSFFGRVCTIECDRTTGICKVVTKGYLYTIINKEIPLNEIEDVTVKLVISKETEFYSDDESMNRPQLDFYSLLIHRGIKEPLTILPDVDVNVHDVFNYADPIINAVDTFKTFLADPSVRTMKVTFGTYRTGFTFTILLMFLLGYFIYNRTCWILTVRLKKDEVWRGLEEKSKEDTDEMIGRNCFKVAIHRGKNLLWTDTLFLYQGSRIEVGTSVKTWTPWKKHENSDKLPSRLPKKFKDEIGRLMNYI